MTSRAPQISVLMANYNNAPYLGEAITSILGQTYGQWELLICDDASTDRSREIAEPLLSDDRIRWLQNRHNIGYIETLRRLIAMARADIVGICDSDDALCPHALERMVAAYREDPTRTFVYSRVAGCDAHLRPVAHWTRGGPIPEGHSAIDGYYVSPFRTFRRSAYRRTAGLDSEALYAEDHDLNYRLEEVGAPHFVDEVLYLYRYLPDSQSHEPRKWLMGLANDSMARYRAFIRRRGEPGTANLRGVRVARLMARAAWTQAQLGRWPSMGRALAAAAHALLLDPPEPAMFRDAVARQLPRRERTS